MKFSYEEDIEAELTSTVCVLRCWVLVTEMTLNLNGHQLDRTRNSCQFSAESQSNSSNNSWQLSTRQINITSLTDSLAHHD